MQKKTTPTRTNIELREQLNQVARLRLFRNTNQELGKYIEYNLQSNNSIKNIPPFTARCIFRELCRETYEQLECIRDLEQILNSYKEASDFYDKYIRGRKKVHQYDNVYVLLKFAYVSDYQVPVDKQFLKDIAFEMYNQCIDVPTLLLLMLRVLPLYTSKKGDVKDIMADFKKVYHFLKDFIADDENVYDLPVLERLEKKGREQVYCNRAYLIFTATLVLETYRSFANSTDLYALSSEVGKEKQVLDIDEAFWVEPEMLSAPMVCWRFEQLYTNDYFLYRYVIHTGKRQISYIRYAIVFAKNERGEINMTVIHPECILALVNRQRIDARKQFLFSCEVDDVVEPNVINLHSMLNNGTGFPARELIRLVDKQKINQLTDFLESERYEKVNQHPNTDYTFWVTPLAITNTHIYLHTEVDATSEKRKYYRISNTLTDGLTSITTNDSVGIMELNDCKYIVIEPLLLYIEITDEEVCRESGVDIVDEIVIYGDDEQC